MIDRSDTQWYRDAIFYQLHVKSFFDANDDGVGDFEGVTSEARLRQGPRRHGDLGDAVLPLAAAGRRLRHRRLPRHQSGLRHDARLPPLRAGGARPRPEGHHRARHQPHLGPASLVPEGAALRKPGLRRARLLRLVRHRQEVPGHPHHLPRHGAFELDLGSGRAGLFLAPLLRAPARSQLRQSARARGRARDHARIGSTWASTACGSTPSPT